MLVVGAKLGVVEVKSVRRHWADGTEAGESPIRRASGLRAADNHRGAVVRCSVDRRSLRGEHYTVDGMRFLPRPLQRPRAPV